jgi:hypothetical protein
MLDCDIIIYDGLKSNYDEICFVIKGERIYALLTLNSLEEFQLH